MWHLNPLTMKAAGANAFSCQTLLQIGCTFLSKMQSGKLLAHRENLLWAHSGVVGLLDFLAVCTLLGLKGVLQLLEQRRLLWTALLALQHIGSNAVSTKGTAGKSATCHKLQQLAAATGEVLQTAATKPTGLVG